MAANASKMQGIVNGGLVSSTVSSKCSSSYSSPSNFWRSTMPDLQHSRGGSSQLNYGHNVSNESTLDMSGGDGSDLQSRSESDMVSRMFQSSQGTQQESCQNSDAHRVATDQTTTTSSSHRFSYNSGGKNGALKGKRRLRSVEDGECQSEEECTLDGLKKRGCSMTKRSRIAEVHNLSERRRRDRINEKMKILQELIPNCSKADKASILEEAIQYLKLLQLQVQILTMKTMTAYSGVSNLPIYSPTYSPIGMDMGLSMAMGMGMMGMGGTVVQASVSDRVIPILGRSPTIGPYSGTVLVNPHGMGMAGMGGTMLSSTIAPTAAAVVSYSSTPTAGTAFIGLHDKAMVGMEGIMIPPTIAPTSRTIVVSATSAPSAPTLVVNPPGMGMVSMGGTTGRACTSDRVVPTMRGSSTISPASGTVLDSSQEIYGIGMTSIGTIVHASISDRVVPTLRASSIMPPSSGTVSVSVSPQEDIYVPSLEL